MQTNAPMPTALFLASDSKGRASLFQMKPGVDDLRSVKGADRGTLRSAVVSADGRAVATLHRVGRTREVRILAPDTAGVFRKLGVTPGTFDRLRAVSGDGRTVAVEMGRNTLGVWRSRGGTVAVHKIDLRPLGVLTYGVALSVDGGRLAFSTFDKGCPIRDRRACGVTLYGVALGGQSVAPKAIVRKPGAVAYNPQFTRGDGRELLYMSSEADGRAACKTSVNQCRYDIRRVSFKGGKSTRLVSPGVLPSRATNGVLSFRRRRPGPSGRLDWSNSSLWIQSPGKKARRVLPGDVALRYHHVSPLGRWVLLHRQLGRKVKIAVYRANGTLASSGLVDNRGRTVGWYHRTLEAGSRRLRRPRPLRRLRDALALARSTAKPTDQIALLGVDAAARLRLAPKLKAPATVELLLSWLTQAAGRVAIVSRTHYCTLRKRVLPSGGRFQVLGTFGAAAAVADPGVGLVVVKYVTGAPVAPAKVAPGAQVTGASAASPPKTIVSFDGRAHGGGMLELVGIEHPKTVRVGSRLPMTLSWRVGAAPSAGWQVFVHIDGRGSRVPGDHVPTLCGATDWKVGSVVRDTFDMEVTSWRGLSPGAYSIYVGWFRGTRRAAAQGSVTIRDHRALVGRIRITN